MGGGVICSVVALITVVPDIVSAIGEMHSNEGGKFAEFRNQTDFAETALRKDLGLATDDEVHLSNIALQVNFNELRFITIFDDFLTIWRSIGVFGVPPFPRKMPEYRRKVLDS